MTKSKPWSFSVGKRKSPKNPSSVVRVYERPDVPGRIFLTRAWVQNASGRLKETTLPEGISRDQAKLLAKKTSLAREEKVLSGSSNPLPRTGEGREPAAAGELFLEKLLEEYHDWAIETEVWGPRHVSDQERIRSFWLEELSVL